MGVGRGVGWGWGGGVGAWGGGGSGGDGAAEGHLDRQCRLKIPLARSPPPLPRREADSGSPTFTISSEMRIRKETEERPDEIASVVLAAHVTFCAPKLCLKSSEQRVFSADGRREEEEVLGGRERERERERERRARLVGLFCRVRETSEIWISEETQFHFSQYGASHGPAPPARGDRRTLAPPRPGPRPPAPRARSSGSKLREDGRLRPPPAPRARAELVELSLLLNSWLSTESTPPWGREKMWALLRSRVA